MVPAAVSPEVAMHAAEPPEAAVLTSAHCVVMAPSNALSACHVTVEGTIAELSLYPDGTTVEPTEVAASAADPLCNDWSEACGSMCSKIFIRQRQNQTGKGQRAKTGISEAGQRRKNTRQKSGSQAQVQSSKVGQSRVKHRHNKQQDG